ECPTVRSALPTSAPFPGCRVPPKTLRQVRTYDLPSVPFARHKQRSHQLHRIRRIPRQASLRWMAGDTTIDKIFDLGGIPITRFQRQDLLGLCVERRRASGGIEFDASAVQNDAV